MTRSGFNQKKYSGYRKAVSWVRGSFKNKKKMRGAILPLGWEEMQALAQKNSLLKPVADKCEFNSVKGPRSKKLSGLYDSPYVTEVAEEFGYPIRYNLPKNIIKKSKTGFATLLVTTIFADYARVMSIANGVEFGKYLFDDSGKTTLYGNQNAFEDERLYSLQHHVLKEIKKKVFYEMRQAELFYKKAFERFEHRLKRNYRNIHRWTHLEFFWVFRTFDYIADYKVFGETIYEIFGEFIAKVDADGEIQDAIKFEFLDDEKIGVFLKVYRFTEDLIKVEVQFTKRFFGVNSSEYRYDNEILSDTFSDLEKLATSIVSDVFSQLGEPLTSSYSYEDALQQFLAIAPKYGKQILSMFKVGNGFLRVTSTNNQNLYRSIANLVKANLVYKLKRSRYMICEEYKVLLKEGKW